MQNQNKKPSVKIIGHINHEGEKIPVVKVIGGDRMDFNLLDRTIEESGLNSWLRNIRNDERDFFPGDWHGVYVKVLVRGGKEPSLRVRVPIQTVRLN